ncbi:MAG: DUF6231 family protein [Gammaproteobacteria bacterium]|nr:DUF6231 family protein [Gammaproteobacteria bacterium]
MTPEQTLHALLAHCRPTSLTFSGTLAQQVTGVWQAQQPDLITHALSTPPNDTRFPLDRLYDLALLTGTLDTLSARDASLLLGQLRNCGARQIALLIREDAALTFDALIGLGFTRHARFDEEKLDLYAYDIASYNHKRSWNNAEHWANPQNWGKYWW